MAIPNNNLFSLQDVINELYDPDYIPIGTGLSSSFTDSDAAQFDPFYGSKTMSPKKLSGFCNYGHNYYYLYKRYLYSPESLNWLKIIPTGWRLPTLDDITILIATCGGDSQAGAYLKEAGTTHWSPPNTGAYNYSGFTSVPSGLYNPATNAIEVLTLVAAYWLWDTEYRDGFAYFLELYYNTTSVTVGYRDNHYGHAVRCIREDGNSDTVAVDGDGNIYQSVFIGPQRWLTQDLHTTRYNDGTLIDKSWYKRYYKQFF